MEAYSLSWLKLELKELRKDRHAFASALDYLQQRVIESNETDIPRRPLLHEWSGTRAAIGSLEMALHAIERTIGELDRLIYSINNREIIDLDAPIEKTSGDKN